MRGPVDALATAHPLGRGLPGMYHADELAQQLCAAADDVLAPVVATLDSLPAYLDPSTAPDDVLDWLAGWVAVEVGGQLADDQRRSLVRQAVQMHRWRGTIRGIREGVRAWFGYEPEVLDSGGAGWAADPGGATLPGRAAAQLVVRVRVPDLDAVDVKKLDAVVAGLKPAHVPHEVDVVLATP